MVIKTYSSKEDYNSVRTGTSSAGVEVDASRIDLETVLGEPTVDNGGDVYDKVQYEWVLDVEIAGVHHTITIYDYKEYRVFDKYEEIYWHIGAKGGYSQQDIALAVRNEIRQRIDALVREI